MSVDNNIADYGIPQYLTSRKVNKPAAPAPIVAATYPEASARKRPSPTAKLGGDIDSIAKSFNTWAFKREQPDSPERLHQFVAAAVQAARPIDFAFYWGRGPRNGRAQPDIDCLNYISSMAAKIRKHYPHGASIHLIFTDTHARLNGYDAESTEDYFSQIEAAALDYGFRGLRLGQLVAAGAADIGPEAHEAPLDPLMLDQLEHTAAKWFRGEGGARRGAELYYRANMIERRAVEIALPHAIFASFNGSDQRGLFPESLPVFYMYSLRRGFSVKPWFLNAEGQPA